jgi:hypothetical protein
MQEQLGSKVKSYSEVEKEQEAHNLIRGFGYRKS